MLELCARARYNSGMKEITFDEIVDAVKSCVTACGRLTPSCKRALAESLSKESGSAARFALSVLLENAETAERGGLAVCQDTGMAVFYIALGQDVHITGGLLGDAVDEGVRQGYAECGWRASVLDPLTRVNTKDNTPAILHIELTSGDKLVLDFLPKGFGSENMSRLFMLTPSAGIKGVEDSIVEAVRLAGANPCPPVIVGVGIGGTAEKAMETAKRQLLRPVGEPSADRELAALESRCLARINALGIGAQGFGGDTTALAVHCGKFPTHIASLPVAVNIQCNAMRLGHAEL